MLQKVKKSQYSTDKIGTIIGELTELEGSFTFSEAARIDGKIKGEIISKSNVIIGETGRVEGNIMADNLLIAGSIEGDIKCEKVEITSSGRVIGNISTNKIVIDENAVFAGKCDMNDANQNTNSAMIEEMA